MAGRSGRVSEHTKQLHAQRLNGNLKPPEKKTKQNVGVGGSEAQVVLGVQLAKVLQKWKRKFEAEHERGYGGSGIYEEVIITPLVFLQEHTGISARRLSGILRAEFRTVSLSQAEAILIAIDQEYMLSNGTIHVVPNPSWNFDRWIAYMEERGCI